MDERGCLQSVAGSFAAEVILCESTELAAISSHKMAQKAQKIFASFQITPKALVVFWDFLLCFLCLFVAENYFEPFCGGFLR